MAETSDATARQTRLRHALQALAAPAAVQLGLLPAIVCKADELALDFDHWRLVVLSNDATRLTEAQQQGLAAIDARLDAMSGGDHPELWTDAALHTRPEWAAIRQLAAAVLASFGWPVATPPSYAHEYVPSRRPEPSDA